MTKGPNVLDVVTELNRELQFSNKFHDLMHECNEEERKRITQSYMKWLFGVLEAEQSRSIS